MAQAPTEGRGHFDEAHDLGNGLLRPAPTDRNQLTGTIQVENIPVSGTGI